MHFFFTTPISPIPCSLLPAPCSLFPLLFLYTNIKNTPSISLHRNPRRHDQENVIEEKG
ncbi:hypothetical protein [Moorena sp. SIO3I6]|uniref:hypothetical protein n=1 Tax=Moorena sp. SIO3I6 TaxID=2607831 RepID=UPI0013FBA04A|nr:hypothetical protein [Moorena sp. SIO3I6]NEP27331.1 hypothetical protein [Moorena sp. SIO3I6]